MESLSGKEPYVFGHGVAVNRDMLCWELSQDIPKTDFITVWDGNYFLPRNSGGCYEHACEIPQKRMRPMTPRECALLPHGTMFASFDREDNVFLGLAGFADVINHDNVANTDKIFDQIYYKYCLPEDLTDDIVSSPWKPLEVEE